jgi:hypothetical protein
MTGELRKNKEMVMKFLVQEKEFVEGLDFHS